MTSLDQARAYFKGDRFATENGAVIDEVTDTYAVCSLTLNDRHRNAMGNVMGGVLFMLGDFAFAVASNFGKHPTVSTTSQITFLRPAQGNRLTAGPNGSGKAVPPYITRSLLLTVWEGLLPYYRQRQYCRVVPSTP